MYVLDTNAFYYAAGISQCTYDIVKLQSLIEQNEVFISSTSLFEFLIKYRNDIITIHKGGKYLWDNKIKLAANIFNPLPKSFSGDIMNISEKELNILCEEILDNKINIESRFISILFDMCLFSGFYFTMFLDESDPSLFSHNVFEKVFLAISNSNTELFNRCFTEGYKTDDCENHVRHCFYDLLAMELERGLPFIEKSKIIKDDNGILELCNILSADEYAKEIKKITKITKKRTSTAYLQGLATTYRKRNNDPQLEKYMLNIKDIFDRKVRFSAMQDYFYDTLIEIMTKGAALWKNDFLDAIIMCNVQDLHILITYDNGVIKRMEKRKKICPKYLESLNAIEELKK